MGIRSSKKPSKPRKLTDEECDEGIELYRQRYHDENLTASDIKKLESVPGWSWGTPDLLRHDGGNETRKGAGNVYYE
jgi:hypothetical protein